MSEDDALIMYRLKVSLRGISPMIRRRLPITAQNCAVTVDFNYVGATDEILQDNCVDYSPATMPRNLVRRVESMVPIRSYKFGIIDGPGNPDSKFLARYYHLLGALEQIVPEKPSFPMRQRGNVPVNCRAGRSRSVILAALLLHLQVRSEFPTLTSTIGDVCKKRDLRPPDCTRH